MLWTDGPWYDTGDIARLLFSSGAVSCLELQDVELTSDEGSTLFTDEGLLMTLRRTRDGAGSEDTGGVAADEAPPWLGEWTASGSGGGWSWTLESLVFLDGEVNEAPASETWLEVSAYDGGGAVDGSLGNGWYEAAFAAEHCGEMRTFIYY